MTATNKPKHGGNRKVGRDKIKCAAYRNAKTREKNKSKRVFRSNGANAYRDYCKLHGLKMTLLAGI